MSKLGYVVSVNCSCVRHLLFTIHITAQGNQNSAQHMVRSKPASLSTASCGGYLEYSDFLKQSPRFEVFRTARQPRRRDGSAQLEADHESLVFARRSARPETDHVQLIQLPFIVPDNDGRRDVPRVSGASRSGDTHSWVAPRLCGPSAMRSHAYGYEIEMRNGSRKEAYALNREVDIIQAEIGEEEFFK